MPHFGFADRKWTKELFIYKGRTTFPIDFPVRRQAGVYIKRHPLEEWSTAWDPAGLKWSGHKSSYTCIKKTLLFPGPIPTNFSWWQRTLFYFLIMENAPIFNANMTTATNTITEIICIQLLDVNNSPPSQNQYFKGCLAGSVDAVCDLTSRL